jgi:hypothetical protein
MNLLGRSLSNSHIRGDKLTQDPAAISRLSILRSTKKSKYV